MEARRLTVTPGRERCAQSTRDLASALGKSADTITSIQHEGVKQRLDDREFARRVEKLDEIMVGEGQ